MNNEELIAKLEELIGMVKDGCVLRFDWHQDWSDIPTRIRLERITLTLRPKENNLSDLTSLLRKVDEIDLMESLKIAAQTGKEVQPKP